MAKDKKPKLPPPWRTKLEFPIALEPGEVFVFRPKSDFYKLSFMVDQPLIIMSIVHLAQLVMDNINNVQFEPEEHKIEIILALQQVRAERTGEDDVA